MEQHPTHHQEPEELPITFGVADMTPEQALQLQVELEAEYKAAEERKLGTGDLERLESFEAEVYALPTQNIEKARKLYLAFTTSDFDKARTLMGYAMQHLAQVDMNPELAIKLWIDLIFDDVAHEGASLTLFEAVRTQSVDSDVLAAIMDDLIKVAYYELRDDYLPFHKDPSFRRIVDQGS
jgi:hypothetical protein